MRRVSFPPSPPTGGGAASLSLDTTTTLSSPGSPGERTLPVLSEVFTLSVTWLRVEEFTEEAGRAPFGAGRLRAVEDPGGLPAPPEPPEFA
ncbi:hypothetical protein Sme01_41880 [Sphaerisporangium melleum]|uniref:Uncharacterized protein n=1 Tax=Sphaerisporangium melleum TaxID=321316 RepID=A0A917RJP6_9ACTN|nr:hypothetical protein GCM10007964_62150 [Sphaerisporangium melleum]GII71712.1 hypothetical protein Sme01_41880 [Sphaerisporangium melleum]